jgi:hypothetical protein
VDAAPEEPVVGLVVHQMKDVLRASELALYDALPPRANHAMARGERLLSSPR